MVLVDSGLDLERPSEASHRADLYLLQGIAAPVKTDSSISVGLGAGKY